MFKFFPVMLTGGLIAGANYALDALGAVLTTVSSAIGESGSVSFVHIPEVVQNYLTPAGVLIVVTSIVAEGMYVLAWSGKPPTSLATKANQPVQLEKKVEPRAISPVVVKPTENKWDTYRDGLLAKQKKLVSEIELLVNSLQTDFDKLSSEDAYDYDQIVNQHLPNSLDLYKKATMRRGDKSEATTLISSQLENMKSGLEAIYSHVDEGMLHEMRIQSGFLQTKYSKASNIAVFSSKEK